LNPKKKFVNLNKHVQYLIVSSWDNALSYQVCVVFVSCGCRLVHYNSGCGKTKWVFPTPK